MALPALPDNGANWATWGSAVHAAVNGAAVVADIGAAGTATGDALRASFAAPTAIAVRHANDRRAATDALLAEAIPGASVGAVSGPDGATTISGGVDVNAYDDVAGHPNPLFRFTQAGVKQGSQFYPLNVGVIFTGLDSTDSQMILAAEFLYDGSTFDLRFVAQGAEGRYRIWADGLVVGTVAGSTDYGYPVRARVTLPDARPRFIKIECARGSSLLGITRQPSAGIAYPTTRPKGPRVILMGDSYTEGVGASTSWTAYASRLALHMGWNDLWASGSGGTGYLNPGSNGRKTFRSRVQTDVINQAPNVVIIAGGFNDQDYATASAIGTEAGTLYDTILAGLPNVDLRIVGPWNPYGSTPTANLAATRNAIKTAAQARGLLFIDPIAEQWITDANKATYISGDNVHPNDAGHRYIADRIGGHMAALAV